MNRSMIFTIFCLITAVLVLIHMVKDINNANIVYLNILMQLSFMVVLIDIGVHAKDMQNSKLQEKNHLSQIIILLLQRLELLLCVLVLLLNLLWLKSTIHLPKLIILKPI
ncbi:hypothetical protein M0D70_00695 [Acinetobacter portensis]|uniref:hypothetical protein n=1 Tax=Acinetobacter portensis TaxID=1839785 RepID=UPI002003138C|nr:hypothetical protein [Acinetobacter portensis]MCK7638700.1 hypothetical protein [Acinetobacter portensis]